MDVRNPDPDARRGMFELLVRCFNAEEFRRFVADVDPALTHELPGATVCDANLINHGVDLLLRHGRVDQYFFERWAQLRSAFRPQIFLVAGEMDGLSPQTAAGGSVSPSVTATPLQMAAPQAGQDFDFWSFLAFVLIFVGVVLLFLALRDHPFRVEYTIAAFLIGVAAVFVFLRHYIAALFALVAGLLVLAWIGKRADRLAIERT